MDRGMAVWHWIILAAFVSAMIVSIWAIQSEFHRVNVELEAQELADGLAGVIQDVYYSPENFFRYFKLQEDIRGHAYTVTIDSSGVIVELLNGVSRSAGYENIPVRLDNTVEAGKLLTLTKSGGEVHVS